MNNWYRGRPVVSDSDIRTFDNWYRGSLPEVKERKSAYVSGTVVLGDTPISGASIICFTDSPGSPIAKIQTDIHGRYTIPVDPTRKCVILGRYEFEGKQYTTLSYWDISPKDPEV